MEAALKIFARDGFDGASLLRIAEAANVAHPLIHYHFGSKDNLWRQTVEFALRDLIANAKVIDTASRGLSPVDRLRVLIQAFTHVAARYPDHFGLIMTEARSETERLSWLRENYAAPFLDHLKGILKAAQEAKQIREFPLDHLSFVLMGAAQLYFTLNFTLPKDQDMDRLADQHAQLVMDIFLNGASA